MAWGRIKADRSGPKHGKGFWGKKSEAKAAARRARRRDSRIAVDSALTESRKGFDSLR